MTPRTIFNSPYALWLLLALPWLAIVHGYVFGETYYGEFIHETGRASVWLLLFTLAITPFRLTFPRANASRWLLQRRRYFGVASFLYAVPHMAAYLVHVETLDRMAEDIVEPGMWTGWLAMLLFALLAASSNDWALRQMGRLWKRLHRLVHLAAVLVFAHWVLTAFDPWLAYMHLAALGLLEFYRLARTYGPWRSAAA